MVARLMLSVILVAVLSGQASAEVACPAPTDPDEQRAFAREEFTRGERRFAAEDFESAVEAFRCSYSLIPHPNTFFNMAESLEHAGHLWEALRAYQEYEERYPEEDQSLASERILALEAQDPQPPAAPTFDDPPPDDPPPDDPPPDDPPPDDPPDDPPSDDPPPRGTSLAAWTLLGVGGGLVLIGGGALVATVPLHEAFDEGSANRQEELRPVGLTLQVGGWISLGVGAALATTGAALLLVNRRRRADNTSVVVVPSVAEGGASVAIMGRF